MAATASLISHGAFQPAWAPTRKLRDSRDAPGRSAVRSRGTNVQLPMEYTDPGRAELRSILVRTHAVMHRTKAGQSYEKSVKVVNAEFRPPLKESPGEWFPDVDQVFDFQKGSVDAVNVSEFCDMLEWVPLLFKAMERIKIGWLRNRYPLPLRIVRALGRDDFELISSNFNGPIGDVNRYPGAMWTMSTGDTKAGTPRSKARHSSRERRETRTSRLSRPFDRRTSRAALEHSLDPTAVPKSVVPHRRDWNRLLHRHIDDCAAHVWPQQQQQQQRECSVSGGSERYASDRSRSVVGGRRQQSVGTEAAVSSACPTSDGVSSSGPVWRLMEPLYPPWQLVQEAEQGDRRVSDLSTVSADDAKLIMKRCRQLKQTALSQMDQQYKAKIHKLEDNREQRYRRKVSYLVPPYRTAGADMPAIRRRVQQRSRQEDVALRCAAWHALLLRLAHSLGAANTPRCRQLLERLRPYSRLEGSQTVRGSEKLCLLFMSVPIYEALQISLQMAVLFVHVQFLGGSENVFKRWLEARSLTDVTEASSLIGLFRGETPSDRGETDSLGNSST